jgi:beta-glucanase (GH16 family)
LPQRRGAASEAQWHLPRKPGHVALICRNFVKLAATVSGGCRGQLWRQFSFRRESRTAVFCVALAKHRRVRQEHSITMSLTIRRLVLPGMLAGLWLLQGCSSEKDTDIDNPNPTGGNAGAATTSGGSAGSEASSGGSSNDAGTSAGGQLNSAGQANSGGANAGQPNSGGNGGTASKWKLFWQEEFDTGTAPDTTKWNYDKMLPGTVNKELQNYTRERSENARIEEGVLILEARRDNFEGHEYSSGRINTRRKFGFTYGRIEARARVPKGRGTWPAIWMMPVEPTYGAWPSSGEIDIMEHVGYEPNVVHASAHCDKYRWSNNTQKTAIISVPTATTEFHLYALEWSPTRLDAFVDDKLFFTFLNENTGWQAWPFDKDFHVILNLAVGGTWGGAKGVDASVFPQRLEVDYVRVYKAE